MNTKSIKEIKIYKQKRKKEKKKSNGKKPKRKMSVKENREKQTGADSQYMAKKPSNDKNDGKTPLRWQRVK